MNNAGTVESKPSPPHFFPFLFHPIVRNLCDGIAGENQSKWVQIRNFPDVKKPEDAVTRVTRPKSTDIHTVDC